MNRTKNNNKSHGGLAIDNFPQDWERKTLKDLGVFTKGSGVSGDQMRNAGVPCVGYGDLYMKYDTKFHSPKSFLAASAVNESVIAEKGALLFTATGETAEEIGKCVCYCGEAPIYVGGDIFILNTEKVNPLFVAYQQNLFPFIKQKARYGQGHSVVHIRKENLEALSVIYPAKAKEQEKITEMLIKWDKAIWLKEHLIMQLSRQREALMYKLLIPKNHWTKKPLIDLITVAPKSKHPSAKGLEKGHYRFFTSGEDGFKFTNNNDLEGKYIIANDGGVADFKYYNGKFSYTDHCYVFCSQKIDVKFLFYYLKSHEKRINILGFTGSSLKNLDKKWFLRLQINIPTEKEQKDISKFLVTADDEINLYTQELALLKRQRKALMQLLLTGAVRVNIEERGLQ